MGKIAICIIGQSGAGKSTIAELLGNRGFSIYSTSELVRSAAAARGLTSLDRMALQAFANEYRRQNGMGAFTRALLDRVRVSGHSKIVIEGIRSQFSLNFLQEALVEQSYKFISIAVHADEIVRQKRILSRRRVGDPIEIEEIRQADHQIFYDRIPELMKLAAIQLNNNGDLGKLKLLVDQLSQKCLID